MGHASELAGSETLDSSKDATTVGTYMFDQLILRHRALMQNSPVESSPDRLRAIGALFTTVGANVLGVGGNNTVHINPSASFASTMSSRSLRGLRSNTDKRASIPASFFGAERKGSLSPKRAPKAVGEGGSRSSESSNAASGDRDSGGRTLRRGTSSIVDRAASKGSGGTSRPWASTAPGSGGARTNGGRSSTEGSGSRSRSNSADPPEAPSGGGGGGSAFDGFRGFFGGGTRAERLSVIEDNESVAGSTFSAPLTRGEGGAWTRSGQDSRGKVAPGGEGGGSIPDVRAALAPKHGSHAAELEKLARVAAQQGRSFSTVEGDSSDGDGGVADDASVAAERDTDSTVAGGKATSEGEDSNQEKKDNERECGSGSRDSAKKDTDEGDDEEEEEEEEVLTRETLCPVLEDQILDKAFKIFDLNDNGSVTKEVGG